MGGADGAGWLLTVKLEPTRDLGDISLVGATDRLRQRPLAGKSVVVQRGPKAVAGNYLKAPCGAFLASAFSLSVEVPSFDGCG